MVLRIGILTVSDRVSAGEMEDRGGPAVAEALRDGEFEIAAQAVVPDDLSAISAMIVAWSDDEHLDVIFTTGGTGLGPRDVTPEATVDACPRQVPGIAEIMRLAGRSQTPAAALSRAVAALRGSTLVINLPGSPRGAASGVQEVLPILPHAIATLHGAKH